MVPALLDWPRTIDVRLSGDAISPGTIVVRLGERVRLNVASKDRARVFQVKTLGLDARIPQGGKAVVLDLMPDRVGTFEIVGSDQGEHRDDVKGWLVVLP